MGFQSEIKEWNEQKKCQSAEGWDRFWGVRKGQENFLYPNTSPTTFQPKNI